MEETTATTRAAIDSDILRKYQNAARQTAFLKREAKRQAAKRQEEIEKQSVIPLLTHEQKCAQLLDELRSTEIIVKRISLDHIRESAIQSTENWRSHVRWNRNGHRIQQKDARQAPEYMIRRWSIQFIRHRLTNYDEIVESFKDRVGQPEAYKLMQKLFADKISETYPEFSKTEIWKAYRH